MSAFDLPLDFPECVLLGLRASGCRGGSILVAISGGIDSMVLVDSIEQLRCRSHWIGDPLAVHVDHGLRVDSGQDAELVRETCEAIGWPVRIVKRSVPDEKENGESIEETARRVRYDALVKTATESGHRQVLVAHHRDDQAETVLHHILRGTGLTGLAGMPCQRTLASGVTLHRPLLSVPRNRITRYATERGVRFREDSSNTDPRFTRNRLRHELLPVLARDYNPQVAGALVKLGRLADETGEVVRELATELLRSAILTETPSEVVLSREKLKHRSDAVLREIGVSLWRSIDWPRTNFDFEHWQAFAEIIRDGGRRTFPGGVDVRTSRGRVFCTLPNDRREN